ncbi:hypothetical protein AURDEDRAFT_131909 [Auricularia subglabra TFB-10046 SS5]|uniref:F-box domain-containing protein n=1 Tax=Auricularia subglabra (strain TFB-10046 / SS5) TaxID=717982 RepID=J0WME3_AURST|nr:hypothetical protein AURDEDRAFT_131909 [Auricularia subglabra TFB-10046 SS5]
MTATAQFGLELVSEPPVTFRARKGGLGAGIQRALHKLLRVLRNRPKQSRTNDDVAREERPISLDYLPRELLDHILRYMHVNPPRSSDNWEIPDDLLLQMRRLERAYWHGSLEQAQLSHLRLLLVSPTLHTLSMNNVWLQADTPDFAVTSSGLRALRIDFSRQVQSRKPAYPDFVAAHLDCLDTILNALRPRLESLTLSGYSVRLSSLAVAPWPSLRAFSVTRGDVVAGAPWSTVLSQMPVLSSFTVALDRGETPTLIFPDIDSADVAPLANLRHFTISFPHPDDQVFYHLPSQLLELSLRDTPRYYSARSGWLNRSDTEPILTCHDVCRIFTVLSATNLGALELVYLEDQEEFRMLALLSQSCPNLTLLELHRYPAQPSLQDAWYHGTLSIPVDAIAESLAEFRSLRVLKLNLRFTDYEVTRWIGTIPLDYWERLAEFLEAHAQAIVRRVSQIQMLSFLTWSMCGMHWDTWSAFPGDPAKGPRLLHEDIYHESFEGW